ncbi:MAG: copper transporter [Thermoleophilia bacterium]|nr:copper transporter [Thermoleophilia bacterium]
MFDFRYHVASLAAVFLALVVGIVIGVGLSGQGIVAESEREFLNDRIDELEASLGQAETRSDQDRVAVQFADAAYAAVMENRLAGRRIAVVFVGRTNELRSAISAAISDADGTVVRLRALKVPVDAEALLGAVPLQGIGDVRELGRMLAGELLAGGPSPLWDAVAEQLVIERIPDADAPADGVVVVRSVDPQEGETARLLNGLYGGLTGAAPAVWAEGLGPLPSRPEGFAVLRDVSTALGRVSLAVLLETGAQGEYGPGAPSAVPTIQPVPPLAGTDG